jgi:two-component system, OmpR family, response regulator CssR
MAYRIFLVEDNVELGRLLETYLSKEGFDVEYFSTGAAAADAIARKPDLWVLDIMLPDLDGFELIRQIKKKFPLLPVIFISARDKELDRVLGLEMGSDDYLAKPFLPRELVIRVGRILDRCYGARAREKQIFSIGNYRISQESRSVTENDAEIILTSKEADLLFALLSRAGSPLSRNSLLTAIWGADYFGSDRVVDDLVRRLRKKMPRLSIETVYGEGYRIIV